MCTVCSSSFSTEVIAGCTFTLTVPGSIPSVHGVSITSCSKIDGVSHRFTGPELKEKEKKKQPVLPTVLVVKY